MGKNSLYFNTEEEMNNYFPDGVPSGILAVVGENNVLYSSSNNYSEDSESIDQGGYIMNPEQEQELIYSYAGVVDYYTYGATMSYVVDYVNTYAPAPDLTGYATESYVTNAISDVIGAAPETLDTLQELAYALNDDANFASYVSTELGQKANKSEIPDLAGYATESYVINAVNGAYAYSYALYVDERTYSTAYATMVEQNANAYTTAKLADYATQSYVVDYVSTYGGATQSNWDESDSSSSAYILNKPDVFLYKGNGRNSFRTNSTATGDVKGVGAISLGNEAKTDNEFAMAIGSATNAKERYTLAQGWGTTANGRSSISTGHDTVTYNMAEMAAGQANKSTKTSGTFGDAGNTEFSVGIGSLPDRKNAIEIMQNGDLYAYGVGNYDGTNYSSAYTLAYVINDFDTRIGDVNTALEGILGTNS